jgi:3'-phosphoadenosine 5'-phosphosulfate sulfotransferase (PAPS reductase)/FAD synthetase
MKGENSRFGIDRWKYLKEFLIENPPTFPISAGCCKGAKKDTAHDFQKLHKANLIVTGERKFEGGARAGTSSCFTGAYDNGSAVFRPIFWLKDSDKEEYERIFDIRHSECYWGYGLKRTGCVGCPFGRNWEHELEVAKQCEPKLYKACTKVFAPSYEYTRAYWKFRKHKEAEAKGYEQLSLFDL